MKCNLCIGLPILLVSALALIGAGGSNSPVATPDALALIGAGGSNSPVAHGKNPLNPRDAEPELANMREKTRHRIAQRWRMCFGKSPVFTNTPGSPEDLKDMQDALNALSEKFYKKE